jgi:hypothetical protein
MRFEVLTVMSIKMAVFWDVADIISHHPDDRSSMPFLKRRSTSNRLHGTASHKTRDHVSQSHKKTNKTKLVGPNNCSSSEVGYTTG